MARDARFVAGLVLGVVLIAAFLWTVDLRAVRAAIGGASWAWLAASAASMALEHPIRALRWRVLLQGRADAPPVAETLRAALIGAALNTLLPLRGGDLVRPAVLARRTGVPFATALASTLLERVLDVAGVLGVLTLLVGALPDALPVEDRATIAAMVRGGLALGGGAVAALVVASLAGSPGALRIAAAIGTRLPGPVAARVAPIASALIEGLGGARRFGQLAAAAGLTATMWANGGLALWLVFRAFGLSLPAAAAWFVQCAIALAVVLPQAPGFVGVFHAVLASATRLWGAPDGVAQALALTFWAVCFGPVTVVGVALAWREGIHLLAPRSAALAAPPSGP